MSKKILSSVVIRENLLRKVGQYIDLSEEEAQMAGAAFEQVRVRQNEFLVNNGEPCKYMIYVDSGCLMSYYTDNNNTPHVMQFATAGWWTGDLHSFTYHTPSIYATRALTDSEVLLLTKSQLDHLFDRIPKFDRYFRIIFQNSLVTHQFRIIQNFSFTAEERYLYFQKKYPTLEQFVPLKYIASYLGMTPEFLSKIRRKLMENP